MRKKENTGKKIEELKKRRNFLIEELENIKELEEGVNSPLWKKLEAKCSTDFDEIENNLSKHTNFSDAQIRSFLGERKKIVDIMSVKNCISMRERFEVELTSIKEKIRECEDRHE